MALPVVALCVVGARTAATTTSDGAVRGAVVDAAGPGLQADVVITPAARTRGSTVTVQVTLRRPDRLLDVALTGRAVAHGEPQLDEDEP